LSIDELIEKFQLDTSLDEENHEMAQLKQDIKNGITVENAVDLLIQADRLKADHLKEALVQYIMLDLTHDAKITTTKGWKNFSTNNFSLAKYIRFMFEKTLLRRGKNERLRRDGKKLSIEELIEKFLLDSSLDEENPEMAQLKQDIKNGITAENAVDLLIQADRLKAEHLTEALVQYILLPDSTHRS